MQEISSVSNEKVKDLIKLSDKKYRDNSGLVLIEGYKIFLEAIKAKAEIVEIFVTKNELEKVDLKSFKNITLISDKVSEKLSFNKTSQNFFVVIKKLKKNFDDKRFLILDNIQDPQNLGAIIRTSVACDVKKLYLLNCVDVYNDKVIRASMGNIFKVCCEKIDLKNLKEKVKNRVIYCADMDGENVFSLTSKPDNFGLILGNEGQGVSDEVKVLSNKTISIPMENDVESLNVAVSCGVILYNLVF